MRLLTHNQLVCVRKGCASHYPLTLQATRVESAGRSNDAATSAAAAGDDAAEDDDAMSEDDEEEKEAKLDFVMHLLPNVDYGVLRTAATALGLTGLPDALPDVGTLTKDKDAELLRRLHQVLVETFVQEGSLTCGKCGRSYPIQQGIPNMRLNEDEVQ